MDVTTLRRSGQGNCHSSKPRPEFAFTTGLTLFQLLTTLAVLCITLSTGVPVLAGVIHSNRVSSDINHLHRTMRYAWSEAITRNQVVVVCPSSDGKQCVKSENWEQGWLVFVDENDNRTLDRDEPIMRVYSSLSDGISATYRAFGPRGQYVPFFPTDGMRTNGTFSICVKGSPELSKALIVSKARPRVSRTLRKGKPIDCPA